MKHFDLFSGYGGFSLALERVYGDLQNISEPKKQQFKKENPASESSRVDSNAKIRLGNTFETIGFSEIDKYASAVLKYRWPNIKNYGDITKINWAEVPDFDLLTGGSPCQDLSIAGKRVGLSGERSGLFYEFMRAVWQKKPKYFIWENVKGAISSQNGWDFASVLNEMAEAGYSLWWQILNAKDFGVPQNRERIFVVGFRDECPKEVFFESGSGRQNLKEITRNVSDAQRIYGSDGLAKSQKALGGGMGAKTGLYQVPRGKNNGGLKELCPTITKNSFQNNNHLIDKESIRRLTPTECERLMGLPDGWTSKGTINDKEVEISDSQRYKLCGNGVVVNVVEEIIKQFIWN